MQFYADSAQRAGAYIVYRSEVTAITKNAKGYIVTVGSGTGVSEVQASVVINCAGLDSDDMAALAGIDIDKNGYRLHYCKGQYFRVSARKSAMIKRLVYPVPKPKAGGLGIHATLDTSGSMRFGPG
jgi:L-2-hydroxyglutarate oxidase LhgO